MNALFALNDNPHNLRNINTFHMGNVRTVYNGTETVTSGYMGTVTRRHKKSLDCQRIQGKNKNFEKYKLQMSNMQNIHFERRIYLS